MMTRILLNFSTLIVAGLGFCQAAVAGETDWQENLGGKARAIAAGPIDPETSSVDLAVQFELKKGWKTYWRTPGDSGIPPQFDFSRSSNLKGIEILWPAPKYFTDDYGYSIGYKGSVVLPIRAVAKNPALPLIVGVTVRYGVCEQICVPVENEFSLIVTRASAISESAAALIDAATRALPVKTRSDGPLAITGVSREGGAPGGKLRVTAKLAGPAGKTALFIEGPEDWYFPLPEKTFETATKIGWTIGLADLPEDANLSGTDVTFTLVNGKHAIEQIWRLD